MFHNAPENLKLGENSNKSMKKNPTSSQVKHPVRIIVVSKTLLFSPRPPIISIFLMPQSSCCDIDLWESTHDDSCGGCKCRAYAIGNKTMRVLVWHGRPGPSRRGSCY